MHPPGAGALTQRSLFSFFFPFSFFFIELTMRTRWRLTFSSLMSPSSCTISSRLLSCRADMRRSSSSFLCLQHKETVCVKRAAARAPWDALFHRHIPHFTRYLCTCAWQGYPAHLWGITQGIGFRRTDVSDVGSCHVFSTKCCIMLSGNAQSSLIFFPQNGKVLV